MPKLERKLGLWSCITIVAGTIIGSAIFMKPAIMAAQVHLPLMLLFTWIITGIISMFGGMITAEVGSMLPETGGQYIYYKHMYGDFIAFLFGWSGFIVINTASIAGIAFLFAQYTEFFLHLPRFSTEIEKAVAFTIPFVGKFYILEYIGVKALAIFMMFIITLVNVRSVKGGAAIQVVFTVVKLLALAVLVFGIFFSGKGNVQNFYSTYDNVHYSTWDIVVGFVAAASGALAAYDGWNVLGFVSGEIKNPQKNISKGLLIGISICIVTYLLTTQAYLYMLPVNEMKNAPLVASDAFGKAFGIAGGGFVALLVMVSTFGGVNGNILPCARVTFAMSEEKNFFPLFGKVSKFKTPANALWLQFIWSTVLVMTGSFDALFDMFVFTQWIFYGFLGIGIFILRKKMKDVERPYKVWGYPYVPLVFIAFSAFYFVITMYNEVSNYLSGKAQIINSVFGLVLIATGIPVYWLFKKKYTHVNRK
ncbi:MAG TPA: amino acid permease [Chitinophagaceae bacterium]|nr:amino acid permease [Chitinophagaceae bacterium]